MESQDKVRRARIVELLNEHFLNASDLSVLLGVPPETIGHDLRVLRENDIDVILDDDRYTVQEVGVMISGNSGWE
ncbi:ArsR family transcriptional regulator [Calycomorphotria hydatis]|uniref:HTH arsR-type domain-containing protein n=1 Tax=Calycomorphotria hydatis TaxID=2528027 RepID=A0A517TBZ0_9PLAN|nr:ArsR family transcriptional regulator [Calycomorphotria hydatis]QDT65881.1 hypothetical protein V22_31430 [Calycomorphotria hydatis]